MPFRRPDNQIMFLRFILIPCQPTSFSSGISPKFSKDFVFRERERGGRGGGVCVYVCVCVCVCVCVAQAFACVCLKCQLLRPSSRQTAILKFLTLTLKSK